MDIKKDYYFVIMDGVRKYSVNFILAGAKKVCERICKLSPLEGDRVVKEVVLEDVVTSEGIVKEMRVYLPINSEAVV